MKTNLFNTGILVIALIISLAACKKDEEAKNNSFIYNQKEAQIGTVMGLQYGESEIADVYEISMLLFEKTLTIHNKNGSPDSLSGKGDVLIIDFLTDNLNEITPGEYYLNSSTAHSKAFTIDSDESGVFVDIFSFEEPPAGYLFLHSGKVTVNKNGEEYEITLDLKSNVNSNVTGYYKGKSTMYTDFKKKSGFNIKG